VSTTTKITHVIGHDSLPTTLSTWYSHMCRAGQIYDFEKQLYDRIVYYTVLIVQNTV
jgi:hypothetical protein